jgi:hypothetical protein
VFALELASDASIGSIIVSVRIYFSDAGIDRWRDVHGVRVRGAASLL